MFDILMIHACALSFFFKNVSISNVAMRGLQSERKHVD